MTKKYEIKYSNVKRKKSKAQNIGEKIKSKAKIGLRTTGRGLGKGLGAIGSVAKSEVKRRVDDEKFFREVKRKADRKERTSRIRKEAKRSGGSSSFYDGPDMDFFSKPKKKQKKKKRSSKRKSKGSKGRSITIRY